MSREKKHKFCLMNPLRKLVDEETATDETQRQEIDKPRYLFSASNRELI